MPPGKLRILEEVAEPGEDPPLEGAVSHADVRAAMDRLQLIGDTGVVPPQEPRVVVRRAMPDREILAAMNGLGALLAVRVMLAACVSGAFVLAYLAMQRPSIMAITVLVAYALTTVGPLTYLSTKRT